SISLPKPSASSVMLSLKGMPHAHCQLTERLDRHLLLAIFSKSDAQHYQPNKTKNRGSEKSVVFDCGNRGRVAVPGHVCNEAPGETDRRRDNQQRTGNHAHKSLLTTGG